MTLNIALLLFIIVVAVVLFSLEQLPTDVTAMSILLVLVITGLLPSEQAFAGFGSDTIIMIFGLLILTTTLVHTGVVDIIGRELLNFTGNRPRRLLVVIMVTVAVLSSFISNTATTALFVPITLSLARQMKLRASRLLMPLAFAAILASSVTLVGSSTNIVVSGILSQHAMRPLGMFELTLVGLPIAAAGLGYMFIVGNRLIPDRGDERPPRESLDIRPYLSEVRIRAGSPLIGKTLAEANLGRDLDLTVLRIVRDKNRYLVPQADLKFATDDKLLVEGPRDALLKFALNHAEPMSNPSAPEAKATQATSVDDTASSSAAPNTPTEMPPAPPQKSRSGTGLTEDIQLVEVILLPRSGLVGRTLEGLQFRQRFGLQVLGINRRGKNIYRKLSAVTLHTGDQLLVQGSHTNILNLDEKNMFRVIGTLDVQQPNQRNVILSISIFGGALLLAAFNLLPLTVAIWLGVLLVFVTDCISPDTAYHAIEWKALMVIGSMLAIGQAMEYTGTAEYLARQITGWVAGANPVWLLSVFFGLTMALTQPMSNQAAAVIILPIALETAMQLGLNPRTFAIMIAVGASCSFITPLEPSCLMVYGPGRYKFMDFIKVGAPLTVLIYLIAILMVPLIWPL